MKPLHLIFGLVLAALLILFWASHQSEQGDSVDNQPGEHGLEQAPSSEKEHYLKEGQSLELDNSVSDAPVSGDKAPNEPNLTQSFADSNIGTDADATTPDESDGFNLDPLEVVDTKELNRLAKHIAAIQKQGVATLSEQQQGELAQLQANLYGLLVQHPTQLYAESPLRDYMVYLSSDQILSIERLLASQSQAVQ